MTLLRSFLLSRVVLIFVFMLGFTAVNEGVRNLCLAAEPFSLVGPASCASTTCHGGQVESAPIWNRSFALFLARDPHASAGILLRNERSKDIVTRLNPQAEQSAEAFDNVLRTRCLSCHATVSTTQCDPIGEIDNALLGQGVSCESCHGPASEWLGEHVKKSWSGTRYDQTGFRDNESILERNKTCVRCHVGSRSADSLVRDVNHDLIAAGHPPLRFDLLNFNLNLSQHWDTQSTIEREFFSSSVRLREVGHSLGLAAATQLATQRARDHIADPDAVPWPELADYDCFACHQALSTRSYHLPSNQVTRSPLHISDGLPVWNAWYSSMLMDLRSKPDWLDALSPHRSEAKKMMEWGPVITLNFLERARESTRRSPSPATLLATVIDDMQQTPPVDWHAAAVQYLRIEAVLQDLSRQNAMPGFAKKAQRDLPELQSLLLFDSNATEKFESEPFRSHQDNPRLLSPRGFRADRFQSEALKVLGITPTQNLAPAPSQSSPGTSAP